MPQPRGEIIASGRGGSEGGGEELDSGYSLRSECDTIILIWFCPHFVVSKS